MKTFSIAVIPGDGIGREVTPEAVRLLDAVGAQTCAYSFTYEYFPWHGLLPQNRQDDGR